MGQTAKYNIPYPELTDIANIPKDLKNMAENLEEELKKQEDAINDKNIIIIALNSNYTITSTENNKYSILKNMSERTRIGDKLTLVNEGVKIGQGVSLVRINARFNVTPNTDRSNFFRVIKSSTDIINENSPDQYTFDWDHHDSIANKNYSMEINTITEVHEGDIISLIYYLGTKDIINGAVFGTITGMTIEVID